MAFRVTNSKTRMADVVNSVETVGVGQLSCDPNSNLPQGTSSGNSLTTGTNNILYGHQSGRSERPVRLLLGLDIFMFYLE